jgi:hypothetical protein
MMIKLPEDQVIWQCGVCGKRFGSFIGEIVAHIRTQHGSGSAIPRLRENALKSTPWLRHLSGINDIQNEEDEARFLEEQGYSNRFFSGDKDGGQRSSGKKRGRPQLTDEDWFKRFEIVEKVMSMKKQDPKLTWRELVIPIWPWGSTSASKNRSFNTARQKLLNLCDYDPAKLLLKFEEWKKRK